jgi:hypothetical protein
MGILKNTMSILVLVFFVASLTVGSASAGYWKEKCDCDKDKFCDWGCKEKKCDCHKDKCKWGCEKKDDFDYESFFKYFFGDDDFFGVDDNWFGVW